MPEFKDKKNVFNRNPREEGKAQTGGKAGKGTLNASHLVNLKQAAKMMPKMTPKRQKKG